MRISVLDTHLANQIAAGEVIERPASVVKELVENSLDAGASKITVDIVNGGESLIRVKDNGSGIHPADLTLALKRHATSKIHTYEDLVEVVSLGFRGEALASIASVSRIKVVSATEGADCGFCVKNNLDGSLDSPSPMPHLKGTTIEVVDLFYQTPARKKFLKTARTEFQHIETLIHRLALSRCDIDFELTHNEKVIFSSRHANSPEESEKRVLAIYGKEFMSYAFQMQYEHNSMKLTGWIADPRFSRGQPDMQMIYINGRYVRDKLIMQAVRAGFHDVLFQGRHPAFLLYFSVDPATVDVNVHPSKQEVRFRDSQSIFTFIKRGIQEALAAIKPGNLDPIFPEKKDDLPEESQAQTSIGVAQPVMSAKPPVHFSPRQHAIPLLVEKQMDVYQQLHADVMSASSEGKTYPLGFAVGQVHETYLISQNEAGMVMVDMHAAHERILYEKMKKALQQSEAQRQLLLIPIAMSLSIHEMREFEKHGELFEKLGFVIDLMGENQIAVREMPTWIKSKNTEKLLRDIFSDLAVNESSGRAEDEFNHLLATIACHAALRSPHSLTNMEINALLREMESTENSGCCNHGRPTWRQFSFTELDKLFYRGQ